MLSLYLSWFLLEHSFHLSRMSKLVSATVSNTLATYSKLIRMYAGLVLRKDLNGVFCWRAVNYNSVPNCNNRRNTKSLKPYYHLEKCQQTQECYSMYFFFIDLLLSYLFPAFHMVRPERFWWRQFCKLWKNK